MEEDSPDIVKSLVLWLFSDYPKLILVNLSLAVCQNNPFYAELQDMCACGWEVKSRYVAYMLPVQPH